MVFTPVISPCVPLSPINNYINIETMKKYLKIEIIRNENGVKRTVSLTNLLITGNVSGWLFEESTKVTKVYFQNSNPFSFVNLYLKEHEFLGLCRDEKFGAVAIDKQNTMFVYSVVEL